MFAFRPLGKLKALWDGRRCLPKPILIPTPPLPLPLPLLSDATLTRPQACFGEAGTENLAGA